MEKAIHIPVGKDSKPLLDKRKAVIAVANGILESQRYGDEYTLSDIIACLPYDSIIRKYHLDISKGLANLTDPYEIKNSEYQELYKHGKEYGEFSSKLIDTFRKRLEKGKNKKVSSYKPIPLKRLAKADKELAEYVVNWAKNKENFDIAVPLSDNDIRFIINFTQEGINSLSHEKNLSDPSSSPSFIEQCPKLSQWSNDRKEMEELGIIKRIDTVGKNGRKGNRLETAAEFLKRVLLESNVTTPPFLHEIRAINPALARSLDLLASRKSIDIRDLIAVKNLTPMEKRKLKNG